MSRKKKDPRIETRLSQDDMLRFETLSAAVKQSKSDLAREAIRWYLNNRESIVNKQKNDELTLAIRSMTDRVCGMLARQGAQVGTLFELAWQTHVENNVEERFISATNLVKQKMRNRLTEDERALSEKMKGIVDDRRSA
jgi:hypothetical protein